MSGPVIVAGVRPAMTVEQQLLAELKAAHRLLAVALGCMTPTGQAKFARQAEIMGLGEDGASRHHEREALIARVEGRPVRGQVWPFPSADADARDRMAREHQAQQRGAVVNGPEALL